MKSLIVVAGLALGAGILLACGGEVRSSELEQAVSSTGTPQVEVKTLDSNDVPRTYRILAPTVKGNPKLPMLILMHGWGVTAELTQVGIGLDAFALANDFILVVPEGVGLSWNAGPCCDPAWSMGIDDVQFISDLIDDVATSHRLDRARVYAAGISNGGYMAYRLACQRPDLIAAVGSVAGAMFLREGVAGVECAPGRGVPVIEIHGDADVLVPYAGGDASGGEAGLEVTGAWETVGFWATNNSCSLETDRKTTFAGVDVTCEQFRACKDDSIVELCTVAGGGHNWPGAAINFCEAFPSTCWWWGYQTNEIAAHEVIWDFVKRYRVNP